MANNCLVTKLKGVVDNPDLPIFGSYELEIFAPCTLNISNFSKAYTKNGGKVFTGNPITLTSEDAGDKLVVIDNYKTSTLNFQAANFNSGKLLTDSIKNRSLVGLGASSNFLVGNLEDLTFGNIANFDLNMQLDDLSGNVTKILKDHCIASITRLSFHHCRKLTGNIVDIIGLTSLNVINIDSNPLITGTVEDFVSGQRSNGRTSASRIEVGINLGGVTFKNKTLSNIEAPYNSYRKYMSWDSNGTITIEAYNGSAYEDITNLY